MIYLTKTNFIVLVLYITIKYLNFIQIKPNSIFINSLIPFLILVNYLLIHEFTFVFCLILINNYFQFLNDYFQFFLYLLFLYLLFPLIFIYYPLNLFYHFLALN